MDPTTPLLKMHTFLNTKHLHSTTVDGAPSFWGS